MISCPSGFLLLLFPFLATSLLLFAPSLPLLILFLHSLLLEVRSKVLRREMFTITSGQVLIV